jgi:hypothetical protein
MPLGYLLLDVALAGLIHHVLHVLVIADARLEVLHATERIQGRRATQVGLDEARVKLDGLAAVLDGGLMVAQLAVRVGAVAVQLRVVPSVGWVELKAMRPRLNRLLEYRKNQVAVSCD